MAGELYRGPTLACKSGSLLSCGGAPAVLTESYNHDSCCVLNQAPDNGRENAVPSLRVEVLPPSAIRVGPDEAVDLRLPRPRRCPASASRSRLHAPAALPCEQCDPVPPCETLTARPRGDPPSPRYRGHPPRGVPPGHARPRRIPTGSARAGHDRHAARRPPRLLWLGGRQDAGDRLAG